MCDPAIEKNQSKHMDPPEPVSCAQEPLPCEVELFQEAESKKRPRLDEIVEDQLNNMATHHHGNVLYDRVKQISDCFLSQMKRDIWDDLYMDYFIKEDTLNKPGATYLSRAAFQSIQNTKYHDYNTIISKQVEQTRMHLMGSALRGNQKVLISNPYHHLHQRTVDARRNTVLDLLSKKD